MFTEENERQIFQEHFTAAVWQTTAVVFVLNTILFLASGAATAFGVFLFVFEILSNSEPRSTLRI